MTQDAVQTRATAMLIASEVIFGTLGLFVRLINLPPTALACARGILGSAFLLGYLRLSRRTLRLPHDHRTMAVLLASGVCLTLNWAFLFAAYDRTTLATAELAYEMAPVFVMAVAPYVLHERLSITRRVCLCLALLGIACVSGVFEPDATVGVTMEGIALGLVAACFYAAVMVLNQFLGSVEPLTKTVVQLGVAGAILAPQVALSSGSAWAALGARGWLLLAVVCLLHTGVAFILWFSSLHDLSAQKVAIFNYLDPAVALLTSALVFGERLTAFGCVGAVLILGSTLVSELLELRSR